MYEVGKRYKDVSGNTWTVRHTNVPSVYSIMATQDGADIVSFFTTDGLSSDRREYNLAPSPKLYIVVCYDRDLEEVCTYTFRSAEGAAKWAETLPTPLSHIRNIEYTPNI